MDFFFVCRKRDVISILVLSLSIFPCCQSRLLTRPIPQKLIGTRVVQDVWQQRFMCACNKCGDSQQCDLEVANISFARYYWNCCLEHVNILNVYCQWQETNKTAVDGWHHWLSNCSKINPYWYFCRFIVYYKIRYKKKTETRKYNLAESLF